MSLRNTPKTRVFTFAAFTGLIALVAMGFARIAVNAAEKEHAKMTKAKDEAAKTEGAQGDPYPLATCPVSGKPIATDKPISVNYEGREIRFCCPGCPAKFKADPKPYIEKINKAIIEQETPKYPLDKCPVSGEKLGTMGKPVDYVYKNRLVRFCCPSCIKDFEKDPAKYLKMIDAAAKK